MSVLIAQCNSEKWSWRWLIKNDIFDNICGISHNDIPISIGVFFDRNLVLTSATPIEKYMNNLKSLKVHSIYGSETTVANWKVICANIAYDEQRKPYWLSLGHDNKHSGRHDLAVLFADSGDYQLAPEASNATLRHAFSSFLATPENRLLTKGFIFGGFGYLDKEHIRSMNDLEAEILSDPVLVDCDDYIPRDWGRFICISNVNNVTGVQSGSPLLQRNLIYGIGCFALEKGEDKIFVFTDVRDYVYNLYYCAGDGAVKRWHSRYWKTYPNPVPIN